MKKVLVLVALVTIFIPCSFVGAQGSSPYLMGEWFLKDNFKDGTTQVGMKDTQFTFLNPTPNALTLEYAFFDEDGVFCGCDVDCLSPNGVVRYTMSGEEKGGQFVCTGKKGASPLKTHGTMKTIVFRPTFGPVDPLALQIGFQVHFLSSGSRSESGLKGISFIPDSTVIQDEMTAINNACVAFCAAHVGLCGGCQ